MTSYTDIHILCYDYRLRSYNAGILIKPILHNSHPKGEKLMYNYIQCIVKYISGRRKFPFLSRHQ